MSSLTAIALILALFLAGIAVYHLLDRWFHDRTDAIATGIVRGVAISSAQRRMLLGTSWLLNVGMQIGLQSFLGIGWLLIAASAEAEEVKLFAYLAAFLASIIVLGWVLVAPFWYLHLRTVLREAEAD